MAVLTNLKLIQAIAQGDDNIGSLQHTDPLVAFALSMAEQAAPQSKYGLDTQFAQTYFAAHVLSQAFTDNGGRGPLSSESVGDVSTSYTLPYLNQKSVLGATQYGLMFLEYQNRHIVPARVVKSQ